MTLAMILLSILPGIIQGLPMISDKVKQIVNDIDMSAGAVLGSGVIQAPGVNTMLAAWAGVIQVLKADPNLPKGVLAMVAETEKAVMAALLNDAQAAQLVDWNKIGVIAPV